MPLQPQRKRTTKTKTPVAEQRCDNCSSSRPTPKTRGDGIECRYEPFGERGWPQPDRAGWCRRWSPVTEPRTVAERPVPATPEAKGA